MESKLKLLKTGLLALFLCALSNSSWAQLVAPVPVAPIANKTGLGLGTLNDGVGTVTDQVNTVLFYKESAGVSETGLTLQASLTDASALTFTSYKWYKMSYDGTTETPTEVTGQTTRDLALTALQPGYYKYRVYGLVEDGTVLCQSEEFQDIVFFVLRPLAPTAGAASGSLPGFCIGDATPAPLVLDASVAFSAVPYQGGSYPNPAVGDFELTYRWYAVKKGDASATQINLPTNTVTDDGAANTFTLSDYSALSDPATYHFYVEVQYSEAIKQRDNRPHALWTAQVGGATTPYELIVSPKPGRPSITIEAVND
ncbi:hypothetical protein [Sphingobacterium sp. SYP-B4668]|uniref:hypothetical protein n=1 Tax=Sphingobacterium sp. SYP-B4668 TaxID=2996035 RepID=UPI0022DD221D|nr:hypothetical protein [Sphingobacterium sp. SYP-B4668]